MAGNHPELRTVANKTTIAFVLMSFILFVYESQGQRRIKELEVKELGFESITTYNPSINSYKTASGLTVTLTPLSADQLDLPFTNKNALDGRFHYTHYQRSIKEYVLKRMPRVAQKSDFDFLLEGVEWLFDHDEISENEFNTLINDIFQTYDPSNQTTLTGAELVNHDNPYYVAGRYLSVFLLEVVNDSDQTEVFEETFLLQDKAESLSMLSKTFLINGLTASGTFNVDKEFILERYHFQCPLIVPPRATVVKYLATLPVESASETISILAMNSKKVLTWETEHDRQEISRVLKFYELELEPTNLNLPISPDVTFNITNDGSSLTFTNQKNLFINDREVGQPVEVVSLSLSGNKLFFGRQKITPMTFLDLKKMKRSPILLVLTEIAGVKRKSPPTK
jgi:hypothetical protein